MRALATVVAFIVGLATMAGFGAAASAAGSNSQGWELSSIVPVPRGDVLYDTSAVSRNDIWAVGGAAGRPSLVLHWNGRRWNRLTVPLLGKTELTTVDALSRNDVVVFGAGRTCSDPLLAQYDGASWRLMPAPPPSLNVDGCGQFTAAGPGEGWVIGQGTSVGNSSSTRLAFFDDGAWSIVTAPEIVQSIAATPSGALFMLATRSASCEIHCLFHLWSWRHGSIRRVGSFPGLVAALSPSLAVGPGGVLWALGQNDGAVQLLRGERGAWASWLDDRGESGIGPLVPTGTRGAWAGFYIKYSHGRFQNLPIGLGGIPSSLLGLAWSSRAMTTVPGTSVALMAGMVGTRRVFFATSGGNL